MEQSKLNFEIPAENLQLPCLRCGLTTWQRIILVPLEHVPIVICVHCLAYAIQAVTGWQTVALIERWGAISPLFSNFRETSEAALGIRPKRIKPAKRKVRYH